MLFVQNRGGNYKSLSFFLLQSKNVVEFDLLPLEWVLHSSVRGNLLGWHDSFMVRNRRKYGLWRTCACGGLFGREGTKELCELG